IRAAIVVSPIERNFAGLEGYRTGNDLEDRAGFVGVADGRVLHVLGVGLFVGIRIECWVGSHRQDFAIAWVHNDYAALDRAVLGHGVLQFGFGKVLNAAIEGEHDVVAGRRLVAGADLKGYNALGSSSDLARKVLVVIALYTYVASKVIAIPT